VSAFSAILARLCDSLSAVAAAIVDAEGETVDYAGSLEPFDVKIMAAEWCIVVSAIKGTRFAGSSGANEILVRASRRSFAVYPLGAGYALVLELLPHAFRVSSRALSEAVRDICVEAALPLPKHFEGEHWTRVDVREQERVSHRPSALWLNGSWCNMEVLGLYGAGELSPREVGFRARLITGSEITLVRERLGIWFVEALPNVKLSGRP
jgi:hypothetical protein